jgi:hypothetical protein
VHLALCPAQQASLSGCLPHDLRHLFGVAVNVLVVAIEFARRADYGVAVLLKVHANCVDARSAWPTSPPATPSTDTTASRAAVGVPAFLTGARGVTTASIDGRASGGAACPDSVGGRA